MKVRISSRDCPLGQNINKAQRKNEKVQIKILIIKKLLNLWLKLYLYNLINVFYYDIIYSDMNRYQVDLKSWKY